MPLFLEGLALPSLPSTSYWCVEPLRMENHLERRPWACAPCDVSPGTRDESRVAVWFPRPPEERHLSQRVRALFKVFLSWPLLLKIQIYFGNFLENGNSEKKSLAKKILENFPLYIFVLLLFFNNSNRL